MKTIHRFHFPQHGTGIFILFSVLTVLAGVTASPASGWSPQEAIYETALRTYIARQMEEYKIPGLALAIVRDGDVQFMEGFGIANAAGDPVTPETPFLLASVSKGITALAVMQLVEAGELSLDDPVRAHLPWFEVAGGRGGEIMVAQLLYQTSGFTELGGREANLRPEGPDALEEAVRALAAEELAFAPGEGWEYSNLNYDVLGLLVQEISGQPYGDYIDTNIFAPLEMDNSFASLEEARSGGAADGYYPFFGIPLVFDSLMPYSRATLPSAGLWSTAADMSRYLIALFDGGESGPISAAGLEALHTPGHMFDEEQGYAMGWTVNHNFVAPEDLEGTGLEEHAGDTILFHEGDGLNYKAMAFLIPEIEYGAILLMNTNDPTVTSAFRFFGWDVALVALGAEAQYFPPAEGFAIRNARWIGAVVVLLLAAGLGWMLRKLRRLRAGSPPSPAERRGAVLLAIAAVLPAAYGLLILFPDQSTSLPLVIRYLPDIGLLTLAMMALPVGMAVAAGLYVAGSRRVDRA